MSVFRNNESLLQNESEFYPNDIPDKEADDFK